MKDFITRFVILLAFMGALCLVEASYKKQVYRQDYNTADKNHVTFTYNDKVQVGKTTATEDIAVVVYGTGCITVFGGGHSVVITTAVIAIDGIAFSTNTQAQNDARYLSITSGPTTVPYTVYNSSMADVEAAALLKTDKTVFASSMTTLEAAILAKADKSVFASSMTTLEGLIGAKLDNTPGVVVSTTIGDGTVAQADLAVWYATSSVYAVFTDTIAVNLVGLAVIQRLPFDAILKSWYIVGDATGTATVAISTGILTGTGVTFGVSSISAALSSTQYATGALGGETIPRGNYMRFIVTAVGTCKEIYVNVEVWRRQ